MHTLHLFNPDNDLALATGLPNYTAPGPAALLGRECAELPWAWAEAGDEVMTPLWQSDGGEVRPRPWGWSAAARWRLLHAGVPERCLPTSAQVERMRQLSHRRTASALTEALRSMQPVAPAAVEVSDMAGLKAMIEASERPLMIKIPWSGSGRGLIDTLRTPPAEALRMAAGVVSRQGSVMVEPLYKRTLDFALLYDATAAGVVPAGVSLFSTSARGAYDGNVMAPQPELRRCIAAQLPGVSLDALEVEIAKALSNIIGDDYDGPLGVDMMVIEGENVPLAVCEVNLRMTMGRVAAEVERRHRGLRGRFATVPTAHAAVPLLRLAAGPTFTIGVWAD